MMRVSTLGSYTSGLSAIERLQFALDRTQRQISNGRRMLMPSDDPIAAQRALELRDSIGRLEQYDRNADVAKNRLAQEESILGSFNNSLQRVRELALQANNASQSDETRGFIAAEIREHLDAMIQLANQKDGNGRFLFSGNLTAAEPVSRMGPDFAYNGDEGRRLIPIGDGRAVTDGDPGSEIFFRIRAGNGVFTATPGGGNDGTGIVGQSSVVDRGAWDEAVYTVRFVDPSNFEVLDSGGGVIATGAYQSGDRIGFRGIEFSLTGEPATGDEFDIAPSPNQDVFTTVDRLAAAIEQTVTDDPSRAAMTNEINAGLMNIDQASSALLDVRTRVGARLAAIDNQVRNNSDLAFTFKETLAGIEDLDYAEALSRLSLQATALEAAQQTFVRTRQLSLFNYF